MIHITGQASIEYCRNADPTAQVYHGQASIDAQVNVPFDTHEDLMELAFEALKRSASRRNHTLICHDWTDGPHFDFTEKTS